MNFKSTSKILSETNQTSIKIRSHMHISEKESTLRDLTDELS